MYLKQTSEYNLIFVLQYFIAIRTKKNPPAFPLIILKKNMVGTIVVSWQFFFLLILQMYLGSFKGQGIDFNIARP